MNGFHMMDNMLMLQISKECGAAAYITLMTIYSHRNNQTGLCFPSVSTIAKETGVNARTINRHLVSLKEKGFLDWTSGGVDPLTGATFSNSYTFPYFDKEAKRMVYKGE